MFRSEISKMSIIDILVLDTQINNLTNNDDNNINNLKNNNRGLISNEPEKIVSSISGLINYNYI